MPPRGFWPRRCWFPGPQLLQMPAHSAQSFQPAVDGIANLSGHLSPRPRQLAVTYSCVFAAGSSTFGVRAANYLRT